MILYGKVDNCMKKYGLEEMETASISLIDLVCFI